MDGFRSVSLYNAQGYYQANPRTPYTINNVTGVKNPDGSIDIRFGGDGQVPNCLPIEAGWNYMVRLYRPRQSILDDTWTFPTAQPLHDPRASVGGTHCSVSPYVKTWMWVRQVRDVAWPKDRARVEGWSRWSEVVVPDCPAGPANSRCCWSLSMCLVRQALPGHGRPTRRTSPTSRWRARPRSGEPHPRH